MGFVEENEVEEILADDELLTDSDEMSVDSESEDQAITTLQPKIPFSQRVNAFIKPGDKQFQKVENYFFSLLSTPGLSIDGILEGTFDDHEIMLITPQSGPPDVVRFQLRNAQRYHENLETRFKGHTETLAFKMTCLYFGLPVAPMRSGTSPFTLSPEPNTLETNAASKPNPLNFLENYGNEDDFTYGANTLSLRGGSGGLGGDAASDDEMRGLFTPTASSKGSIFEFKKGTKGEENLNYVFRNSVNTAKEAERVRELRSRTFTQVSTIFTNPLKPVMPLNGPPLESVIKTGPSMPGVTTAMLTPTEVLRLQQEVHSLRFQLLDRTRVCPYADCERYFTFSDGASLDQHIREDHAVLRCFLCDKNSNLLPYYDTDKIKEHFVTEHLKDILEVYAPEASAKVATEETQYESVDISGDEHVGYPGPRGPFRYDPDDERLWNPKANPWQKIVDQVKAGKNPWDEKDKIKQEEYFAKIKKEKEAQASKQVTPPAQTVPTVKDPRKDSGVSFSPIESLSSPVSSDVDDSDAPVPPQPQTPKKPPNFVPKATTPPSTAKTPKTTLPKTPKTALPKTPKTAVPKTPKTAVPRTPVERPGPRRIPVSELQTPVKPSQPTVTKTKSKDGKAEIFTLVNPSPSTFEKNGAWIKGVLERYVAAGGATLYGVNNTDDSDSDSDSASPDSPGKKGYKIFTALNTNPGTSEQNDKFIREQLQQYLSEGGKLPSIVHDWAQGKSPAKGRGKGKRKRPATGEGAGYSQTTTSDVDAYEYSEGSAEPDGPENLVDDAPPQPSAKRPRTATTPFVPVPAPEGIEELSSPPSTDDEE